MAKTFTTEIALDTTDFMHKKSHEIYRDGKIVRQPLVTPLR
jgi:hypothetical protein